MLLLIDNYDSFSYNLVQLAGSVTADVRVIRNDAMTVEEVRRLSPTGSSCPPAPAIRRTPVYARTWFVSWGAVFPFWAYAWAIRASARYTARPSAMQNV